MNLGRRLLVAIALCASAVFAADPPPATLRSVPTPPMTGKPLYTANRAPLAPSPLLKLPIGSIAPRGWLRHMLVLEANGMSGRLPEISNWVKFEGNAWVQPEKGHSGWEEMPYWLKGYGDLAHVLKDPAHIAHARRWVDAILASQREDGWFGPRELLKTLNGKPDLWPNMIALNILQSHYEATGDERVLPFMARYFRWQLNYPEQDFIVGYWPVIRAGDNLESVLWLYNRTGEPWLLELGEKIHRRTAKWADGIPNWHGVNITQGFREPGVYYILAKQARFLDAAERNYNTVMNLYGQFPGGMFGADENARPGYGDPRQGAETCSIVEFMHSFEMLTRISGNPLWADRCEDVAFNSLPAASTPDLKALHYLTGANQVQLDRNNKAPGIENSGNMFSYSPGAAYRCCQHNVAHGWPYFAEELFLATLDGGLCASLYAPSEVTAKVGDGATVTIAEETDYPFSGRISFKLSTPRPVRFPFYLRLPRWADRPAVAINGQPAAVGAKGLSYIVIDRTWSNDDRITLDLPMSLRLRTWDTNQDSVSIDYGPLTFSLKIGERWSRYGGTNDWPEWEVFPTTPWNYGLVVDRDNLAGSFKIERTEGPLPNQPFTPDSAPIRLIAQGQRIPQWTLDQNGLLNTLQKSPARSDQPVETITLIPMGAARLRIAAFPQVGTGPDARAWVVPPRGPLASHVHASDTVFALNDGKLPQKSNDPSIPRFTWWDHKGTEEWVQYEFNEPRQLAGARVYWFDDTGMGFCRTPATWSIEHLDGDQWKPVTATTPYGVAPDTFNTVRFQPITTKALRLKARLRPEFSAGILEWQLIDAKQEPRQ